MTYDGFPSYLDTSYIDLYSLRILMTVMHHDFAFKITINKILFIVYII